MPIAGRCLVCGEGMGANTAKCGRCDTPYHAECLAYAGRCSVYGCQPVFRAKKESELGIVIGGGGLAEQILAGVLLLSLIVLPLVWLIGVSTAESVGDGEIVMHRTVPYVGQFKMLTTAGKRYTTFFSENTVYTEHGSLNFSVRARFKDTFQATINGTLFYRLPRCSNCMLTLHGDYGSNRAIEDRVIKPEIDRAVGEWAKSVTAMSVVEEDEPGAKFSFNRAIFSRLADRNGQHSVCYDSLCISWVDYSPELANLVREKREVESRVRMAEIDRIAKKLEANDIRRHERRSKQKMIDDAIRYFVNSIFEGIQEVGKWFMSLLRTPMR